MEKSEFKIEIRDDILYLLQSKADKLGYTLSDLFRNFALELLHSRQLSFTLYNRSELPPIISSVPAERIDTILRRLRSTGGMVHISYDAKLTHVIMSEETSSDLIASLELTDTALTGGIACQE